MHGPHHLLHRGLRIGPVTEHKVHVVEAKPLERAVNALHEVLTVEGEAGVGPVP